MLFSGKIPFHVAARLTPRFWVPHLLRFATIRDCSPLFALFETIRTIRTIRYSGLFAVHYSRLFAIRYSGFPDTPVEYTAFISGHLVHFRFSYVKPNHIMITPLKDSVVWRVQVTNNMNP